MNNLYIIHNILTIYTHGMAVISAPSLKRCRELFAEDFGGFEKCMRDYDSAIEDGAYQCHENVNIPEGLLSYVYGGS